MVPFFAFSLFYNFKKMNNKNLCKSTRDEGEVILLHLNQISSTFI